MTAPQPFNLNSALEKFESRDKDFRCMALADLNVELGKESFHFDAEAEKKLTKGILKLLQDDHSQVQELAVKVIGSFSQKLTKENLVQEIVTTLGGYLQNEKKDAHEMREVASNAFKNVVNSINDTLSSCFVAASVPLLMKGIKDFEKNQDIIYVSLEALNELLSRFSSKVSDKAQLLQVVQPQLRNKRQLSRKEAASCLGYLANVIPTELFNQLINNLIKGIQEAKGDELRSYVFTVSYISRSASERIGKFLSQIIPILLKHCDSSNDDNLREDCFQCLETFVLRCPREVSPFLKEIHELCLKYIKMENLVEEEQEGSDMEQSEEEEEGEEEDEEQEEDDEDMTWKVRRGATKCLVAIISTRFELINEIYERTGLAFIVRFKRESEENVRGDVYSAFITLLRQLQSLRHDPELESKLSFILVEWGTKISNALSKFLTTKGKSAKAKAGAFGVLKELCNYAPEIFKDNFASWIPGLEFAFKDKGSSLDLKREALQFLAAYFKSHPVASIQPHLKTLNPLVFKAIRDSNAKISADALRAGYSLVPVLRASGNVDSKTLDEFYTATLDKLKTADTEVPVKESSIACMSLLISYFAPHFKNQLPTIIDIFVERVSNEITATAALKAFEIIATVQPQVELGNSVASVVKSVSSSLSITSLQQIALSTLSQLVKVYGSEKSVINQYSAIANAAAHFVSDSDLQLAQLALTLYTHILQRHSAVANGLTDVVNRSIQLLCSAQLPSSARRSITTFLAELCKVDSKNFTFDSLHKTLSSILAKDSSPSVISNVARGIGAICSTAKPDKQEAAVAKYAKEISSKEYHVKQLAFLVLGELASVLPSHQEKLLQILLQYSGSSDEATRLVVSDSLGRILAAIPKEVLGKYLEKLKSDSPFEKISVLTSIRYAVLAGNAELDSQLQPALPSILELLQDPDVHVRRQTTSLIHSLLRQKLSLIKDSISKIIPHLYDEAKLKPELIKVIDLGTTKHTVDNGYDNRVSAFECINLILDIFPQYLQTKDFIPNQLVDALKNQGELLLIAESILLKLINIPSAFSTIASSLDSLLAPLVLIISPPPSDPNKKEPEEKKIMEASDEEVLRLALRIVSGLSRLPETLSNSKLGDFITKINSNPELAAKFNESGSLSSREAAGLRSSGHQSLRASRQ